jgi:hypothetical protein
MWQLVISGESKIWIQNDVKGSGCTLTYWRGLLWHIAEGTEENIEIPQSKSLWLEWGYNCTSSQYKSELWHLHPSCLFQILGIHNKTTWLHKPNDYNLQLHNHETLKSEAISRVLALTRCLNWGFSIPLCQYNNLLFTVCHTQQCGAKFSYATINKATCFNPLVSSSGL